MVEWKESSIIKHIEKIIEVVIRNGESEGFDKDNLSQKVQVILY